MTDPDTPTADLTMNEKLDRILQGLATLEAQNVEEIPREEDNRKRLANE